MEMENRDRETARSRRKRKRSWRRSDSAAMAALLAAAVTGLVGVFSYRMLTDHNLIEESTEPMTVSAEQVSEAETEAEETLAQTETPAEETSQEPTEAAVTESDAEAGSAGAIEVGGPLPNAFDLRDRGINVQVPEQGEAGNCWAFAAAKAMETSMDASIRQGLSADHMSMQNSFGRGLEDGGNYAISSAYALAWQGPVAEAEDISGDGVTAEGLQPVCHVQEMRILDGDDIESVKRTVYEFGGVQSACYVPEDRETGLVQYYNEETGAYYYDGELEANHDLVIMGWDDSYSKENFVTQPSQDGAFLCMNTWGEQFGNDGYFYISYEDTRIGRTSVAYTKIEPANNYDRIFQTDLCGWVGQLGYNSPDAWFANVYETDEDLKLAASGFYATVPDTEYTLYVALVEEETVGQGNELEQFGMFLAEAWKPGSAGPFSKRVKVAEGVVEHAGYYTIPYVEELMVQAGERFAVIAKVHSPDTVSPVAIEFQGEDRTANVDISDGEGYISYDGTTWTRIEDEKACNICLKAYARES